MRVVWCAIINVQCATGLRREALLLVSRTPPPLRVVDVECPPPSSSTLCSSVKYKNQPKTKSRWDRQQAAYQKHVLVDALRPDEQVEGLCSRIHFHHFQPCLQHARYQRVVVFGGRFACKAVEVHLQCELRRRGVLRRPARRLYKHWPLLLWRLSVRSMGSGRCWLRRWRRFRWL